MNSLEQYNDLCIRQLDTEVIKSLNFREHDDQRLAPLSIESYTMTAVEYNHFLEYTDQNVSVDSIREYFDFIRKSQAPATFNLKRQALKKVLKAQPFIRENMLMIAVVNELFARIKRVKEDKAVLKDEYLTQDEIKTLIDASSLRLGLIIEFLFKTGCRVSEMIHIRLQDIQEQKAVRIRVVGKGNKERCVFIDTGLFYRIKSLFDSRVYLFESKTHHLLHRVNISAEISQAGKRIGKKIHAHTLRHSCIMHLLQHHNLKYVSKYAGHSSSAITADMYVHENPGDEVLEFFDF